MELIAAVFGGFLAQLQTPTLAFLIFGVLAAALRSQIDIPEAIYKFCIFILLVRIGMSGGMEIRDAGLDGIRDMLAPAILSAILGVGIVVLGSGILARLPRIRDVDAIATAGLFGAVSSGTLLAGILYLDEAGIRYEGWIPALYPFMDIPALITAIVMANRLQSNRGNPGGSGVGALSVAKQTLQGHALTAMVGGVCLGLLTKPDVVFDQFYDPLFKGFLSILMLILGIEAYSRAREVMRVAHWYIAYALLAPVVHGLMGFALGYVAHRLTGLSPGGVILLAIMTAGNSDASGPPTIRGGIPSANPSTYIGASTGLGTPVAIGICVPLFVALGQMVFGV